MSLRGQRVRLAEEIHAICLRIEHDNATLKEDVATLLNKMDQFMASLDSGELGGVDPNLENAQQRGG